MDTIFFRFYLVVLFSFLLILSFFISRQLLMLIFNSFKLNDLGKGNMNYLDDFRLIDCYLFRGELFLSISLCELYLELNRDNSVKVSILTLLAYIYTQKAYYSISEYYYYKALSLSPQNREVVYSLDKMYRYLGYRVK